MEIKLSPATPETKSKRPTNQEVMDEIKSLRQDMDLAEKNLFSEMDYIKSYLMKSFIPRYDFEHHIHNECGECIADGCRNINYARDKKLGDKFEAVLFKQGSANTPIPTVPQPEIPKPEEDPNTITCKKEPEVLKPNMIEYPLVTYDSSDLRDVIDGEMKLADSATQEQWKGVKDIGMTWELVDVLQSIGQNTKKTFNSGELFSKISIHNRYMRYMEKAKVQLDLGTRNKVMTFPEYVNHQLVKRMNEHLPFKRICKLFYKREDYNPKFHQERAHTQFLEFTIVTYNWGDVKYTDDIIKQIRSNNPPKWYTK